MNLQDWQDDNDAWFSRGDRFDGYAREVHGDDEDLRLAENEELWAEMQAGA